MKTKIFLHLLFALVWVSIASANYCGLDGPAAGGVDSDNDGWTTDGSGTEHPGEIDCDDTNFDMYPGRWRESGGQFQRCETTGLFSALVAQPNEAKLGGTNFFIDCDAGVNGTGTFASPWNTTEMVTYLSVSEQPAGYHEPIAGDAIWIGGTCTEGFDPDGAGGFTDESILAIRGGGGTGVAPVQFIHWPGKSNVWTIDGVTANRGFWALQSTYVDFIGFDISGDTGTKGKGIKIEESNNVRILSVEVHDIDGEANNNVSGIEMDGFFLNGNYSNLVSHSKLYNNFDRAKPDNQNNRNISYFRGDGHRITRTVIYYDDPAVSASILEDCVGYKHAGTDNSGTSTFELDHSVIYGCATGLHGAQSGMSVHHNWIKPKIVHFRYVEEGGPIAQTNLNFHHNTLITPTLASGKKALDIQWDEDTGAPAVQPDNNVFEDNIILLDVDSWVSGEGFVLNRARLSTAAPTDATAYARYSPLSVQSYDRNVYYNFGSGGYRFDDFSNMTGYGGVYDETLVAGTGWPVLDNTGNGGNNNKPARDSTSFFEDPVLDSCDRGTSANALGKGYLDAGMAGPTDPTTVFATITPAKEPDQDGQFRFDIETAAPVGGLTISYNVGGTAVAGTDYAALSGTILIPAGQTSITLPLEVINDGTVENTKTVILTVTGTNDAGWGVGVPSTATLLIEDDDSSSPPWWRRICRYASWVCIN